MIRLLASVVLIVTSAGAGVGDSSGSSTGLSDPSPRAGRRVLIVPFENARHEPRVQWLSEAAAVLLSDELAARGLDAISRAERARAFDDLHLPASASLSRATVIKIGQLVSATEVIVGSFDVDGSTLAIRPTSSIDVGRLDPNVTDRASLTDLFGVFSRLAGRLAPDSRPGAAGPAHPSLDAFENYVKGLIAERPATQATFLEMAVRQQPSYDQARIALWDVRTDQADYAAALAAVRAVPAASPLAPQAHFLAALSLLDLKRLDEAFDAFKALVGGKPGAGGQPSSAAVFNNLGIVQLRRGGTPQTGSATYYLTKAAELEPADPDYLFNLGYAYALEHNAGATVYWLREAVRRNPADADAHYVLGSVLLSSGSPVEGARERELARQLASRYEQQMERRTGPEVPKGLERVRVDSDPAPTAGAEQALASSAQRDQREQAAFHLERARRLFDREDDREAMTELNRAAYLSPYEAKAHLLIRRIHLRAGPPTDAVAAPEISVWSETRRPRASRRGRLPQAAAARRCEGGLVRALALDPASADAKEDAGDDQVEV